MPFTLTVTRSPTCAPPGPPAGSAASLRVRPNVRPPLAPIVTGGALREASQLRAAEKRGLSPRSSARSRASKARSGTGAVLDAPPLGAPLLAIDMLNVGAPIGLVIVVGVTTPPVAVRE